MSKNLTKRALSLLIALALTLSLVPAFAYAAEGEATTAEDIVLEFNKNTITDKDGTAVASTTPDGVNFEIVTNDTTNSVYKTTDTGDFKIFDDMIRVAAYMDTYKNIVKNWLQGNSGKPARGTFTVSTEVPGGIYEVKVSGYQAIQGCMVYVYVDDEYVGIYDCYDSDRAYTYSSSGTNGNAKKGDILSLGYVTVEPDEGETTKNIEIQFINAAVSYGKHETLTSKNATDGLTYRDGTNMYLSSVTLHPVDAAPTVAGIECDIPNSVKPGESFTIAPKVKLSDGSYKAINGYLTDRTKDANNNISASVSWNISNLTLSEDWNPKDSEVMYETNGSYAATFTAPADADGKEADVKVTAVVDGVTYVYKKTVWVLGEEDSSTIPNSFTLQVVGNTAKGTNDKYLDSSWTTHGYNIVLDKSPTFSMGGHVITKTIGSESKDIVQYRTYSSDHKCWPEITSNHVLTLEKNIPSEGWYKLEATGYIEESYGGLYAIYINGQYAGDYKFYNNPSTTASYAQGETKQLNTLKLPEGNVELAFFARKTNGLKDSPAMYLDNITFTKTTAPTIESVNSDIPATMEVGTTADCTAQAVMSDGTRSFGYTVDGALPKKDVIKVESTDNSVVEVSNVVCVEENVPTDASQTIDPTTTTYTLTAKKPGTATITVTALVDGVGEETTTQTIEVPYADTGATTIDDKISYIVRAEDSANNSNVTVSDGKYTVNGTNVGEWTVGESFTATAKGDGFAYWANGSGTPVSESPIYTFKPTSNFTLKAVYAPASTATKKVQFWNYNKVYLGDKNVTEDNKVSDMPANPSLNGYTFKEWVADGIGVFNENTTIKDAITRVVAQFTEVEDAFTIDGEKYNYDEMFAKTAEEKSGEQVFSYWTIDGQVASYNKELSFNAWDSVDVVAVYEGAKTAVPTVVLDKVDHTNSPDEYFILYEVPTGYTLVDAGIVFGTSGTTPTVRSTDGSKASAAKLTGQFTAAPGDDSHTAARGYVMYRDSYNNLRVLYTEVK